MENVKIGFRWFIRRKTFNGFEEYEPHEETFDTYAQCIADVECNYPEYKNDFGVDICEDDDGLISFIATVKEAGKVLDVE